MSLSVKFMRAAMPPTYTQCHSQHAQRWARAQRDGLLSISVEAIMTRQLYLIVSRATCLCW